MFQLSHSEALSDALVTDSAVHRRSAHSKVWTRWVRVFFVQLSPVSWFFLLYFLILCDLLLQEHKLLESKDFAVILQSRTWQMFRNTG